MSFHRLQIRYSKILLILARPLLIGYFTFYYFSFSDFKPDGCVEPYAWRRVYTFRIRQPTSSLVIPKSPQYIATRKAELGGFLEKKMNICKGVTALFKIFF